MVIYLLFILQEGKRRTGLVAGDKGSSVSVGEERLKRGIGNAGAITELDEQHRVVL
jgi:hypothetical protein